MERELGVEVQNHNLACVITSERGDGLAISNTLTDYGYRSSWSCSPEQIEASSGDAELFIVDGECLSSPMGSVLHDLVHKRDARALVLVFPTDEATQIEVLRCPKADILLKPLNSEVLRLKLARHACRSRIQHDLEKSEKFILRVTEATPELLYLFDFETGEPVYVNRRLCATLGCKPHEIHARECCFFASAMSRGDAESLIVRNNHRWTHATDDDVIESDCEVRDCRRHLRWLHCREVVFDRTPSGGVKQILGTAQDTTDRRELETTRALLAAIVESSREAIIGKTLSGDIISWNSAAERLYGYTREDALGQNVSLLVPPGHDDELPELLDQIRHGNEVKSFVTERRCEDGTLIEVSLSISPIRNKRGEVIGASTIARLLQASQSGYTANIKTCRRK